MRFLLSFVLIAIPFISDSVARPRKLQLKRQQQESECEFAALHLNDALWVIWRAACIVALSELPLQITTCAEALKAFENNSTDPNGVNLEIEGSDCIAEATLGIELPNDCGGCFAVLDGECPNDEVPCTGPPSK
ncbi:hypothetical protein BDZ97DRAFT_1920655 [Flammula alnicola]|nr:hypothetical protein BDZ97DRAFT_1920655 [Flammula alnicola]